MFSLVTAAFYASNFFYSKYNNSDMYLSWSKVAELRGTPDRIDTLEDTTFSDAPVYSLSNVGTDLTEHFDAFNVVENSYPSTPPVPYVFSIDGDGFLTSQGNRDNQKYNIGTKFTTNSPAHTASITFQLTQMPTTSQHIGFGFGLVSGNQVSFRRQSIMAYAFFKVNPSVEFGLRYYIMNGIPADNNDPDYQQKFHSDEQFASVEVNDVFTLSMSVLGEEVSIAHHSYRLNQTIRYNGPIYSKPNNARLTIIHIGGFFKYLNIEYREHVPHPSIICLGDSKTRGNGASSVANYYPNKLNSYLKLARGVAIYAGGGDQTKELLRSLTYPHVKAKIAILCIGRNDIYNIPNQDGTLYLTDDFDARRNYNQIVNVLKSRGVKVIHLLPIPENTYNQDALKTFITRTYPQDMHIDPSVGWISSYLSGDNIHPNDAGYDFIAQTVANALKTAALV